MYYILYIFIIIFYLLFLYFFIFTFIFSYEVLINLIYIITDIKYTELCRLIINRLVT